MPRISKTITTKRVGATPSGGATKRITGTVTANITLRLAPGATDFGTPEDFYWELEANTDHWLLENGDLWVLEQ